MHIAAVRVRAQYVHLLRSEHAQGLAAQPAAAPRREAEGGRDLVGEFRSRLSDVLRSGRPERRRELEADDEFAAGARRSLSPARVQDGSDRLEDMVKLQRLRNRLSSAALDEPSRIGPAARAPAHSARLIRASKVPRQPSDSGSDLTARIRPASARRPAERPAAAASYHSSFVSSYVSPQTSRLLRASRARATTAQRQSGVVRSGRKAAPQQQQQQQRGAHARLARAATSAGLSRLASRASLASSPSALAAARFFAEGARLSRSPGARSARGAARPRGATGRTVGGSGRRAVSSAPTSPLASSRLYASQPFPRWSHAGQQQLQQQPQPARSRRLPIIALPRAWPLPDEAAPGSSAAEAELVATPRAAAARTSSTRRGARRRPVGQEGEAALGVRPLSPAIVRGSAPTLSPSSPPSLVAAGGAATARSPRSRGSDAPSIAERLARLEAENARLVALLSERGLGAAQGLGAASSAEAAGAKWRATPSAAGSLGGSARGSRRDVDVPALQAELAEANAIRRRQERHIRILTAELGDVAAQAAQVRL